jgi:hypothetical protein
LPVWARLVAGYGDNSYEPLPAEGLQAVSFDFSTGMMAGDGCGDPVWLPLPVGTVLPPNPYCSTDAGAVDGAENQGIEWLQNLLN